MATAMIVGTFHFMSRVDMVKSDVVDVSTAGAHAEIDAVVDRLADYAPSKVVLEMLPRTRWRYAHYRAYLAGERSPDPGEREQIGFRLARRLGARRVFPMDILHRRWEPSVEDRVARDAAAAKVWAELEWANLAAGADGSHRLHALTVLAHLALMNEPASQDAMGAYLTLSATASSVRCPVLTEHRTPETIVQWIPRLLSSMPSCSWGSRRDDLLACLVMVATWSSTRTASAFRSRWSAGRW